MSESAQSESVDAGKFYSRALERVDRFMLGLIPLLAVGTLLKFGLRPMSGFVLGCVIAYVNFHWLKRVISAFVDRAAGTENASTGQGIVFRFLFRYVLMAIGAYAILTVSPASLHGLLAGLFLPVAAILCEAAYELYVAFARGI